MQITAIMLARALAFIEVDELNPKGVAYYPDIARALVQRFNFQTYPTKPEEFDERKGVLFADGKFANGTVDKVQIYTHGLLLDTRMSTDVSAALLREILLWAKSDLGLHFEEGMIKRQAFVSQLTFESTLKLNKLNPVLPKAESLISSSLSVNVGQAVQYETTAVILNLDRSMTKLDPGPFTIERRAEVPFVDNKYFSSAPLSTQDHIGLLHEIEKVLV